MYSSKKERANHLDVPGSRNATGRPPLGGRPVFGTLWHRMVKMAVVVTHPTPARRDAPLPLKAAASEAACLRTDADPILDHVERLLGHDILGHQFALHFIGAIADDPVGHVFRQPEEQHHLAG